MADPVEDFLENDNPVPGQNYVCLSFVSPESIIEKRELFYMEEFFKKNCEMLGLNKEKALNFLKTYDDFKYENKDSLSKLFNDKNDGLTSVRGIKVRGTYDTLREAQVRAKVLQRRDPNFHVYVGQVGFWLPWDPDPNTVEKEEYLEGQLNELVKSYKENQRQKDEYYEETTRQRIEKAKVSGEDTSNVQLIENSQKDDDKLADDLVFDSRPHLPGQLEQSQAESDKNLQDIKSNIFDV